MCAVYQLHVAIQSNRNIKYLLFVFNIEVFELIEESKDDSKNANCPVHVLVTGVIEPSVIYE